MNLNLAQKRVVAYTVLACISELCFSGVINGWSTLYLIYDPKTKTEIDRANWIYAIGNIVSLFALLPQGLIIDRISNKFLFITHSAIGILGYGLMIFASWRAQTEIYFCQTMGTWIMFILSQVFNNVCANGMHLAVMCYIPKLIKRWSDEKSSQQITSMVLYTVTNGAYAVGPLIVWILYKIIGPRQWLGLATYSGVTILILMAISLALSYLWKEETKKSWPKIEWKKFKWADLIEFTIYKTVIGYFIICFMAFVTMRVRSFTITFSLMLPLIGVAMTIILSLMSLCKFWAWSAWVNKFSTVALVSFAWAFLILLYTCTKQEWLWILACVIYCILCPIFYSVIAYYFDSISIDKSRGMMRGTIASISGLPLFSISAWIRYSTNENYGYLAFDLLCIILIFVVNIALLLRHESSWR